MATSNDLNIEDAGYVVFDGVSIFTGRTFQAGTGINLTNASGVSGNTTITSTASSTIFGDTGSISGSSVTIYANNAANNSGGSVKFVNSGTISTFNVTDSSGNTYIGKSAGVDWPGGGGGSNTIFGSVSGSAIGGGSANNTTSIGYGNINAIRSATGNIAVGTVVLNNLVSGNRNIALGNSSCSAYTTTESDNISINNAGVIAESNTIRIGTQGASGGQQNKCYIAGIVGVTASNAQVVTINSATGQLGISTASLGTTWSVIIADQSAVAGNGYITNKASALVLTLPASASIGDIIEVTGINTALGWKIAQNANQQIFLGNVSTTLGVTGFLQSTAIRDTVKIVCVVSGASSVYNVISAIGNITVA